MTDNNAVIPTSSKTLFDPTETPYVFFGFPSSWSSWLKTDSTFWRDPSGDLKGLTADVTYSNNKWYKLNNWDTVKENGLWSLDAGYFALGWVSCRLKSACGKESFNFQVVPEPVSWILFSLGGGTLLLKKFHRKKSA